MKPTGNEDEPLHRVPRAYFPKCRHCNRRHPWHESCLALPAEADASAHALALGIFAVMIVLPAVIFAVAKWLC